MEDHKHELIVCIVNAGFSQNVMEAARAAGAQGGTVIRARGSANPEAEEFFSINIQPDKEVLLILVPRSSCPRASRTTSSRPSTRTAAWPTRPRASPSPSL